MKPDLLICDEVVSALDVSIQGQILNLLLDLRRNRESSSQELSFLFIAHDLKVACYFCDRIGVMYQGVIMEEAPAAEIWKNGIHPYTELLFSSVGGRAHNAAEAAKSNTPGKTFTETGNGCAFVARCPYAQERCFMEKPELRVVGAPAAEAADQGSRHLVRCWN